MEVARDIAKESGSFPTVHLHTKARSMRQCGSETCAAAPPTAGTGCQSRHGVDCTQISAASRTTGISSETGTASTFAAIGGNGTAGGGIPAMNCRAQLTKPSRLHRNAGPRLHRSKPRMSGEVTWRRKRLAGAPRGGLNAPLPGAPFGLPMRAEPRRGRNFDRVVLGLGRSFLSGLAGHPGLSHQRMART